MTWSIFWIIVSFEYMENFFFMIYYEKNFQKVKK